MNLYATLSNSNNIIFDTITADPDGEKKIYNTVKNEVKKGGCAIFIDVFGGIDDIFLKKIEIEYKI